MFDKTHAGRRDGCDYLSMIIFKQIVSNIIINSSLSPLLPILPAGIVVASVSIAKIILQRPCHWLSSDGSHGQPAHIEITACTPQDTYKKDGSRGCTYCKTPALLQ